MAGSDKSKNVDNIRGARSLNELLSVVDLIEGNINDLDKRTDKILSSLSNKSNSITISLSSGTEREIGDLGTRLSEKSLKPGSKSPKGKKVKVNSLRSVIEKGYKAPNEKDLVKNSVAINELNSNIKELEISLRVLQSKDFAKLDSNSEAAVHIKTVLNKAVELRTKQLKAMSVISKQHTPKQHTKLIKHVRDVLKKELSPDSYSSITAKTYTISKSTGVIWFQTYITVSDISNTEGYVYEEYSYVFTTVFQTKDGELRHHITTRKTPEIPGSFPIGKEVESVGGIVAKLRFLNHQDQFLYGREKFKIAQSTEQLRYQINEKTDGNISRTVNKYIKGIRVKDNRILVGIDESITETQKKKLVSQLFVILRSIFFPRESRSKSLVYRDVRSNKTGKLFLEFSLSVRQNTKTKEFVDKMSHLVEVLDLSPMIQRSVLQRIVEEYEP